MSCAPSNASDLNCSRSLQTACSFGRRFPHIDDSLALAEASQRDGIMLAPGTVFRPHLERSPWLRFNVAVCEDTRVQRWLQRQAADEAA